MRLYRRLKVISPNPSIHSIIHMGCIQGKEHQQRKKSDPKQSMSLDAPSRLPWGFLQARLRHHMSTCLDSYPSRLASNCREVISLHTKTEKEVSVHRNHQFHNLNSQLEWQRMVSRGDSEYIKVVVDGNRHECSDASSQWSIKLSSASPYTSIPQTVRITNGFFS
mmetsp:Transcript_33501/g.81138  ORF Transcript_33501/g.81138 Transcript_33501/m.81138 type:complete len:165 (-) Transcript_33501:274-768(-)